MAVLLLRRPSDYEELFWLCKRRNWTLLYPIDKEGIYSIHGIRNEDVEDAVKELRAQPYVLAAEVETAQYEGHVALRKVIQKMRRKG